MSTTTEKLLDDTSEHTDERLGVRVLHSPDADAIQDDEHDGSFDSGKLGMASQLPAHVSQHRSTRQPRLVSTVYL